MKSPDRFTKALLLLLVAGVWSLAWRSTAPAEANSAPKTTKIHYAFGKYVFGKGNSIGFGFASKNVKDYGLTAIRSDDLPALTQTGEANGWRVHSITPRAPGATFMVLFEK